MLHKRLCPPVEVYSGLENPLTVRRKYSITFQCQFDLKMYPFDQQVRYLHCENINV